MYERVMKPSMRDQSSASPDAFPLRWLFAAPCRSVRQLHEPPAGCCQSLVTYRERYLVLFAGGSLIDFTNDVHVFDMDTKRWFRQLPENSDMVAPRLSHSAVIHKDKMIVYGGQDMWSPVVYDDVLQLDLVEWRWSVLPRAPAAPDGPGARCLHNAHVIGDRMYVLMGSSVNHRGNLLWYLDLRTYRWHPLEPTCFPNESSPDRTAVVPNLRGCSSAVSGDRIFLFGGYYAEELTPPAHVDYVNALYEYNTQRNTWRTIGLSPLSPHPLGRCGSSLAVHHGRVYLFGGDANQSDSSTYLQNVWLLDMTQATLSWQEHHFHSKGPSARSGCAYACARASLFIVGGELPPLRDGTNAYSSEVLRLPLGFSYRLTLREWTARWLGAGATLPPWERKACFEPGRSLGLSAGALHAADEYFLHRMDLKRLPN